MAGYDYSAGMSNNAVQAYSGGLCPASKIKGVPAKLVKEYCSYSEWHHSSKFYNKVEFYDPEYVRATFGLIEHEEYEPDPEAIAALDKYKAERRTPSEEIVYEHCKVEYKEWSVHRNHPVASSCVLKDVSVTVKGGTATFNGIQKRLSGKYFSFRVMTDIEIARHYKAERRRLLSDERRKQEHQANIDAIKSSMQTILAKYRSDIEPHRAALNLATKQHNKEWHQFYSSPQYDKSKRKATAKRRQAELAVIQREFHAATSEARKPLRQGARELEKQYGVLVRVVLVKLGVGRDEAGI